jgi:hypothetical protein
MYRETLGNLTQDMAIRIGLVYVLAEIVQSLFFSQKRV